MPAVRLKALEDTHSSNCPKSQPSREGASYGKFLRLRVEIGHMNWFSLENRAA
jgi:hypothetical protein